MIVESRLEIVWDGPVPGLAEHRISIDAFGNAILLLLKALRRIASNMLAEAVDPATRGRLQKHARLLDIEIDGIKQSSSGFTSTVVLHPPKGETLDLFENLTQRSVRALLSAIEAESEGEYRDVAVRSYLQALPEEVTGQRYTFTSSGAAEKVSVGSMKLPATPSRMSYLLETSGFVTGVGFPPGKPYVYLATEERRLRLSATEEQVEEALKLRDQAVTVFVVMNGGARLLNVRPADAEVRPLDDQQRERYLFGKWDELLQRLAQ